MIAAIGAGMFALPAAAQLHENISVDGRYVPDVIRIERVNAFPKTLKSILASSPIEYESRGVNAAFHPSLVTLPATGWRSTRELSLHRGYLEFGVGSWLNSTLSAGYRFVDNSTTLFGVRLQHNSTSLWKPEMSISTEDVKQFRYDESVGLYGSHVVKGKGRLDAALDYHVGYYNYYGYTNYRDLNLDENINFLEGGSSTEAPTQTINDIAMRLDWRSLVSAESALSWYATGRVRHFAYRHIPHPQYPDRLVDMPYRGTRETNVGLEGGLRMPWDNGSSIGVDGNIDMIFLANSAEDNYGMFTLTPYYRFSKGLLDIRVGADVDFSFKAGYEGYRYPFIHVAPDVRFGVQTGQVGVYLNVLGGSTLNTLTRLHQLDYYSQPFLNTTRPTFTPLDAAFGINLGPFSGFSLGVKARYVVAKNVPLGGWYTAWLSYDSNPLPGMKTPSEEMCWPEYVDSYKGIDIKGYSVSGNIGYEYGDTFGISAEGSYQPQDGKKGFFNGYDRAKIIASAKAYLRPVKHFKIGVGYDYRGDRRIYTTCNRGLTLFDVILDGDENRLGYLELPDISMLNLSASWDFTKSFTIWLQADNILNRHDELLPLQPTQGLVIAGGLKLLF